MAMKKKKHKARRKSRRRANPVPVIFANPRRKRRKTRRRRATVSAAPRRRRRRRSHAIALRSHAPLRTHRRRRRRAGTRRMKLYRRRHNPGRMSFGKLKSLAGIGLFGGLGIVTARIGGMLYKDHLSKYVLGASPDSTRNMISDVLRLVAMGALTIGVDMGLGKVRIVGPTHRTAFKIGGLAETGRQAIGLVVKKAAPSYQKWGLDGYGRNPGLGAQLENADSFMGDLEDASSFDGADLNMIDDNADHPYADMY